MKTNHFEDTLRRKLESIEPRFREQDWERMQQYMQVQTPPPFWQAYGTWLGYAASLLAVGALAGLFVNQRSQNEALRQELAALRGQLSRQQSLATTSFPKPDTVYMVQQQPVFVLPAGTHRSAEKVLSARLPTTDHHQAETAEEHVAQSTPEPPAPPAMGSWQEAAPEVPQEAAVAIATRLELDDVQEITPQPEVPGLSTKLAGAFGRRFPQAGTPLPAALRPESTQHVVSTKKEKRLWPIFNTKVPLRLGGGQQWENRYRATSLLAEVLLGKHVGISSGVSWQKLEQKKFFTEKSFRNQMLTDFRKAHGVALPPDFEIFNINTRATLLQVPLNLTYRGDMGEGFSYVGGVGTAISVQARQNLSFNYRPLTQEYGEQHQSSKESIPAINNFLVSVGVEKRWHPLVLQVDSYLNTYLRTYPFLNDRNTLGVRVRLLYEFGGNKI